MELDGSVTIDEGVNDFGVRREITLEGDQAITKLSYDAQPLIDHAADLRAMSAGDSWGNGHFIGIVPMAELTRINETYQGAEERKRQMVLWLKANPKLVTFEKFLK